MVQIKLQVILKKHGAVPLSPVFVPKPKWDSATQTDIYNYHEQLDVPLLQEPLPECLVSCDDLQ